jgi:hypothetical protein
MERLPLLPPNSRRRDTALRQKNSGRRSTPMNADRKWALRYRRSFAFIGG